MSFTNTTNEAFFTGNGVTVAYDVDFKVQNTGDIQCYVDGIVNAAFTVAIDTAGEGATITFVTPPANTKIVLIRRIIALKQETEIERLSQLPETTLESAYDRAVMMIVQLQSSLKRALKFPITSQLADFEIPTPSAGKALRWNDAGTALQNSALTFDTIIAQATAQAVAAAASAGSALSSAISAASNAANSSESAAAAEESATDSADSEQAAANSAASAAASALSAAAAGVFAQVTLLYTDFQAAALTKVVTFRTLPAKRTLVAIFVKHSTAFAGTLITDVKVSLGVTGDDSQFILDFDVDSVVADSNFEQASMMYLGSFASGTALKITMTGVGANLSALTAGALDIYFREVSLV